MTKMAQTYNSYTTEKRSYLLVVILASILIVLSGCAKEHTEIRPSPNAVNGILDLSDWDFEDNGSVSLDGEWEFYWGEILNWTDFHSGNPPVMSGYIEVPRSWNKYRVNGTVLSGNGYATYRLIIKTGTGSSHALGLKLPRIFTAYSISVDNKILSANGTVAKTKEEAVPQYRPEIVMIKPVNNEIELVIHVSNFSHRSGGMLEKIVLGTDKQIIDNREKQIALELFLFGSLAIIGIYHIVIFIFRRKNRTPLYFGLYCLLIATRTIFVGEIFITQLFPGFNWEIQHKIQTSTFYIGVPLFVMFLESVFPGEFPKWPLKIAKIAGACFSSVVLLTPVKIFTIINPAYQLITFLLVLIVLYTMILACIRKRTGALVIMVGGIFFLFTVVNDMLFLSVPFNDYNFSFLRNILKTGNLSSIGLISFTFTQSVVLAMNTSKAYTQAEEVSEKLLVTDRQKNELLATLEEKVEERTLEMQNSNLELEKAYHDLSLLEKARKLMLTNISHDLKTPMTLIQGYTEAILDGMFNTKEEQRRFLELIQSKISELSHLTDDISELSRLESRQIMLDIQSVSISSILAKVDGNYRSDVENTGLSFNVKVQDAPSGLVDVDINKLDRVFSNLIYNALRYTSEGEIAISASIEENYAVFGVSDTGLGISSEDLPYIFDRLYTASKSRNSSKKSSGLGLAIAKEIIEYHGGKIWAENRSTKGSSFFFTLEVAKQ